MDFSQHSGRIAVEDEARQCTLTVVATIIQKCTELLVLARENSSNSVSYSPGVSPWEILGQACAFNMLLPNVFAHVSSLVSADPKVNFISSFWVFYKEVFKIFRALFVYWV